MENEDAKKEQDTDLLSVQRLRSENDALKSRVTTLEKQVKDMINELKTGSYTVIDGIDGNKSAKKEELERKVKKVFGNGKND